MTHEEILEQMVASFNQRRFAAAAELAAHGGRIAQGREEAFWMGLTEACQGYQLIMERRLPQAETKLVAAMEKLRNFGFTFQQFEVTSALAGVRRAVEEIRLVRDRHKKTFDITLLPQLRLMAKADD
jgi:hypothetical protein